MTTTIDDIHSITITYCAFRRGFRCYNAEQQTEDNHSNAIAHCSVECHQIGFPKVD